MDIPTVGNQFCNQLSLFSIRSFQLLFGPLPEGLQCRADPWRELSKPRASRLFLSRTENVWYKWVPTATQHISPLPGFILKSSSDISESEFCEGGL